jgi:hypothetical protein
VRAALGYGGRLPAAPLANPTARRLLEESLRRLPPEDGRARAVALARLAQVRFQDATVAERLELCDEAEGIARRLDNPVVLAAVLLARCLTLDGPDDTEVQLRIGAELSEIGQRIGDPDVTLEGARIRIPALFTVGRHDEARTLAEQFTALATESHHHENIRLATMWDIVWSGIAGPYDEAEAKADRLLQKLVKAGHPQAHIIHFGQTFVPRWLHGQLDRTRPELDAIGGMDQGVGVLWAMGLWIEAGTGHEREALGHLHDADPDEFLDRLPRDMTWWPAVIGCAVAAACGDARWAEALHDAILPYEGHNCVAQYSGFFGTADHYVGTLAFTLGRWDEAVDRLQRGIDRHQALGSTGFEVMSSRWLVRALRRRNGPGDEAAAAALEAESDRIAGPLHLSPLPEVVEPPQLSTG